MARYTFLYRDAANYKFPFTRETSLNLSVGQEITIEELGISTVEFFSEIVQYPYDSELDHNILEVIAKLN